MAADDPYADLVEAVAATRDRAAFASLFDHFAPRINAFLRRLGTDNGNAEELTQEVMVTLWRKAALFDRSKSSVATWLFRIARNRRIDLARRDRSSLLDPEDPAVQPGATARPDAELDARDREQRVRRALQGLPPEQVERRLASGEIEIAPIAFMRGRTLADAFVILDEAQNTTREQMKMFLTRFGQNSRMVICGDPRQVDIPGGDGMSGLADADGKLEGVDGFGTIRFTAADVVRHPIVGRIVEAYEGPST